MKYIKFKLATDDDIRNDANTQYVEQADRADIVLDLNYIVRIAVGGTQYIGDQQFEICNIFHHPESDCIWAYGRHIGTNQLVNIDFDAARYNVYLNINDKYIPCGSGYVELDYIDRDDFHFR